MDNKIAGSLSTLRWVDRGSVKPNDYNPNKVSKQNLELQKQSILANGWIFETVGNALRPTVFHENKTNRGEVVVCRGRQARK